MKLQEQINRIHEMMGVNESFSAWFMRRFSPEELDNLIKNVKDLRERYEYEEDAIYDAVRQLIATKNFEDINSAETDNQYWDSYLKYEGPLVKYVKEKLESKKEEQNEYARTLKNARRQGVGTRFSKTAINANPMRFRPYNR